MLRHLCRYRMFLWNALEETQILCCNNLVATQAQPLPASRSCCRVRPSALYRHHQNTFEDRILSGVHRSLPQDLRQLSDGSMTDAEQCRRSHRLEDQSRTKEKRLLCLVRRSSLCPKAAPSRQQAFVLTACRKYMRDVWDNLGPVEPLGVRIRAACLSKLLVKPFARSKSLHQLKLNSRQLRVLTVRPFDQFLRPSSVILDTRHHTFSTVSRHHHAVRRQNPMRPPRTTGRSQTRPRRRRQHQNRQSRPIQMARRIDDTENHRLGRSQ